MYIEYGSKNVFAENTCNSNSSKGIYLYTSTENNLLANTCNFNNQAGINLYTGASRNSLAGNVCNNNQFYGIWLDANSNYVSLSRNLCRSNGNEGLRMTNVTNCAAVGNSSIDNGTYGINIGGGCSNNIVAMNQLTGNTTASGTDGGTNTMQKATNYPVIP
jgi:parallel beta-helix repeat protein